MSMNRHIDTIPTISDAEARRLMEKFDAATASLAEERSLYEYFRRSQLPPDLAPLRGLMAWYEGGCAGEPCHIAPATSRRRRPIWSRAWMSAASAAVLIALGITLLHLRAPAPESDTDSFAATYGGSYVIRDGVKITDPELIRDDILRAKEVSEKIHRRLQLSNTDANRLIAAQIEKRIGPLSPAKEKIINQVINPQIPQH